MNVQPANVKVSKSYDGENQLHYIITWDSTRHVYIKLCLLSFVLAIVSIYIILLIDSLVRMQLHYFLNASLVTLANMVRIDL